MKFIIIFGPQAVGKMTVGEEIEKLTGLKLFHNHMTIELVSHFFGYSTPAGKRLVKLFREEIFQEVANSDLDGLIFTFMWAFNMQSDWNYIDHICNIFEAKGADIYFVELETDLEERIERNKSPHRLECKPTKRNIEWSEQNLKRDMERYRLNSEPGEIKKENYIRINNTNLSPEETAKMIIGRFKLCE